MATRDYTNKYIIDASQANAALDGLIAKLTTLDALITRVKGNAQGIVGNMPAQFSAAGNSAQSLTGQLSSLQGQAQATGVALRGAGSGAGQMGGTFATAMNQAAGLFGGLEKLATAGALFAALKKITGEIADALRQAREHAESMGEKSLNTREKFAGLAALMGETEVNDRVMARAHRVNMGAGLGSLDKTNQFLKEFEGSMSMGTEAGHILDKDKADVAIEVARFARRNQIDMGAAGDMAGVIAQHVDLNKQLDANGKPMTPAQSMAAQLEAAGQASNQLGRGNVSTLMKNAAGIAQAGLNSGRLTDPAEAYALTSTISNIVKDPGRISTTYNQASSLVNDTSEKGRAFLDSSGIADAKGDIAKFNKLSEVLDKARKAHTGPRPFDPYAYLADQGFGNETEVRSAVALASPGKDAHLQAGVRAAKERTRDGAGAVALNAKSMEGREAQYGVAKARMAYGEMSEGAPQEDETILRMNAAAELAREGVLNRADQKVRDAFEGGFGAKEFFGLSSQERERINERVRRKLETKAANSRIDTSGLRYGQASSNAGQLRIPDTIEAMRQAGVNPLMDNGDGGMGAEAKFRDVDAATRAQRDAAKLPRPVPQAQGGNAGVAAPAPAFGGGAPQAMGLPTQGGDPLLRLILEAIREGNGDRVALAYGSDIQYDPSAQLPTIGPMRF